MKRGFRIVKNTLISLGLIAATFVLLAAVAGSFFYYTACPAGNERVGLPIAEWQLAPVPVFWEPPTGCVATNGVRLLLGEIGVLEDINPRVPRIAG